MKKVSFVKKHLTAYKRETIFRLLAAIAVLAGFSVLFGTLADEVVEKDTLYADEAVLNFINGLSSPWLDRLVVFATTFGGVLVVTVVAAALTVRYGLRHKWRLALFVAFSIGGLLIVNSILKVFYQRERPELWNLIVNEATYSFPSGHAALSCGLAAVICVMVWRTRWRWYAAVVALLYVIMIGFTRLYLGVHYPTDVIAGWLLAGAWVVVVGVVSGVISIDNIVKRQKA